MSEPKKYTIEEFRNYLDSQESKGDIYFYLNEENVEKAQIFHTDEIVFEPEIDARYWHSDKNKIVQVVQTNEEGLGLMITTEFEEISMSDAIIAVDQEFLFELKPQFDI